MEIEPIGTVRNRVREPRPHGWEREESTIELRPEFSSSTEGLERYSHVMVVTWLHLVPDCERRQRLKMADWVPEQGILATRSQLRPNPIGVTVCELRKVEGAKLKVRGLDAVDGTPVLDVRPYIPYYDSLPEARVPEWARPPG